VDEDGDGSPACEDCDDLDAGVFAGGVEVAGDGTDGDCDGTELCYVDADDDDYLADGAATVESADLACDGPGEADNSALAGDCDDENAAFHPGATEDDCEDPNDYNCDGASGRTDADADGFMACEECDDASGAVNPDADEVCNDVDDDCDGTIDVDAVDAGTWYLDADADGYTDPAMSTTACDAPESYSAATDDDCDDADATSYPGADDLPDDGIDQDCDGADATADATPDDTGGVAKDGGCGCDSTGVSGAWALVLGVLAGATRRRTDRSPVRNVTREGRRGSSSACYTPGLWPPGVG
jgi:MYXO-CTERM domain-containing protein